MTMTDKQANGIVVYKPRVSWIVDIRSKAYLKRTELPPAITRFIHNIIMKLLVVFAVVCFMAASLATEASASPTGGEEAKFVHGHSALKELEPELHNRYKRATCDLLSGTGVNHSACAAHCLLRGNRGGYCNSKAVCVCRK